LRKRNFTKLTKRGYTLNKNTNIVIYITRFFAKIKNVLTNSQSGSEISEKFQFWELIIIICLWHHLVNSGVHPADTLLLVAVHVRRERVAGLLARGQPRLVQRVAAGPARHLQPVLRIHMFLGLLDPDPDPLVRGMDSDPDPALDPDPDPSTIKQI
jgi:hypothetical protein